MEVYSGRQSRDKEEGFRERARKPKLSGKAYLGSGHHLRSGDRKKSHSERWTDLVEAQKGSAYK